MVSSKEAAGGTGLIFNMKISSVGPGRVTGQDIVFEPNGMDLAVKLHYIRAIYYFNSQAFEGLTIRKVKEPMFTWFNRFYMTCGRFRRSESGRPYIKCNDCGVRFIEGQSEKSLDEWLDMKKGDNSDIEKFLVSDKIIGPELAFSPLVFLQVNRIFEFGLSLILKFFSFIKEANFF